MKRSKYFMIFTLSMLYLGLMNNISLANDDYPIPLMKPDYLYLGVNQMGLFENDNSYDQDEEGYSVTAGGFGAEGWGVECPNYYGYKYYSWSNPGAYLVQMVVMDDEGKWSYDNPLGDDDEYSYLWYDTCQAIVYSVQITTPVTAPATYYWPVGTPLQLDVTVTGASSGIGAYTWTKSGGTLSSSTIKNPTFTATQAGTYTITVDYKINNPAGAEPSPASSTSATLTVVAVKVDLDTDTDGDDDIDDYDESGEENPGGYVMVGGERKRLNLNIEGLADLHEGTIEIYLSGIYTVYLWDSQTGGYPYYYPSILWDLSDEDDHDALEDIVGENGYGLYVQSVGPSSSLKDVGITLTYYDSGDNPLCYNTVNLTSFYLDLEMDGVDEEDEIDEGGFIALNDDDDNDNEKADNVADETGSITNEDNLIAITLQKVQPLALTGNVTLKANAGGSKVKIWAGSTKGGSAITLPKTYATPTDLPKTLYVEGYQGSGGIRDIELALEYTVGGKTFDDRIKATVIDVVSIAVDASDTDSHKIPSVKTADKIPDDHFVTVQGVSGDITLLATISPDTTETKAQITWTNMTQQDNKLQAKVSRATSGKYPATVNVGGRDARDLTNWVVWSIGTLSANAINEDVQATKTVVSGGYNVTHTISPSDITDDTKDIPNLKGSYTVNANPPDVPAGDIDVPNKGVSLAGGADYKWDSSRQIRRKVLNPNSINFSVLHDIEKYTSRLNYPSLATCGNDDQGTSDPEYNVPYSTPYKGSVYGYDCPSRSPFHSEGSLNDTFEIRMHMRAFARLELEGKWYRISGDDLWKTHLKFKKQNESEATWNKDFNGDGDKLDTVPIWRNNGSSIAENNDNFN